MSGKFNILSSLAVEQIYMKTPPLRISIERVYTYAKRQRQENEYAVLVDRLWPRGLSKAGLDIDAHLPDMGPSHVLRKWFGHQPERWDEFKTRYAQEVLGHVERSAQLEKLRTLAKEKNLILLYSARDELHNQAQALKETMLDKSKVKS